MTSKKKMNFKKFAVIGAGPVGSIVAAFLAKGGYDVTLCDIIPELVAPATDPGIILEGAENLQQKVTRGITNIDDLAKDPPDVVIITVKATVLHLIASSIQGFYHEGMYVVSWQNGIDTELVLAETLEKKAIMRAVVNFGCGLVKPGQVHMAFHHPPHFIQELDPASRPAAEAIAAALSKGGLATERTDDIIDMVWRKSIMNACMNPVCAVTGMTMAEAMRDPIVFQLVDRLAKEAINVARANEINLGWEYYPYAINYMKNAGDHKPSMLMDIENKRRTEVDFINGKIVEYGNRVGMETPYNLMIRGLVKGLESR
jgi:2-dehydropantoate 2-reductase